MCNKNEMKKAVKTYKEAAFEIATIIGKINDLSGRFDYLSSNLSDNNDPHLDAQEAIEKLGVLLASVVVYQNEYEHELNGENK